ncbi:hypothetical protein TELCIR_19125, partial [Teladorsagia circumcincta]
KLLVYDGLTLAWHGLDGLADLVLKDVLLCGRQLRELLVLPLAAVSFCDLAFLLVMLPHALSSYDTLAFNDVFRFFYLRSKQHIAAVANWMSAAAI